MAANFHKRMVMFCRSSKEILLALGPFMQAILNVVILNIVLGAESKVLQPKNKFPTAAVQNKAYNSKGANSNAAADFDVTKVVL